MKKSHFHFSIFSYKQCFHWILIIIFYCEGSSHEGRTKDGVYEWLVSSLILAFSSIQTSSSTWQHRLEHLALSILKLNISNNKLGSSSSLFSSNSFCNSCLCNKSHKMSFSKSSILSSNPFKTIFSDVWTSPIISTNGFKYYVISSLNTMSSFLLTSPNMYGFTL